MFPERSLCCQIQVMPDDWFSQKEEVPYLFLSANPWACFCSLGYLHRYVDENDFNIYTRSGPLITNDPDSVVRTAAPRLTGSDARHFLVASLLAAPPAVARHQRHTA